jgi:hypothetical protein
MTQRQNDKRRHKSNQYKNKKNVKVMQTMWSAESDNSDTNGSSVESDDEQELNLALMTQVKDGPFPIDINEIISNKNISEDKTIELLRNIVISKNKKLES